MAVGDLQLDPTTGAASQVQATVAQPPAANTDVSGAKMGLTPDVSGLRAPLGGPNPLPPASVPQPGLQIGPAPVAPTMPPLPKPFAPEVPTTIDSKDLANAFGKPAQISPALQQLMSEKENLAKTGFATPEQAAAAAQQQQQPATQEKPVTSTGPSPAGAQLGQLFPDQPNLVDTYEKNRASLGIPDYEKQFFDKQKQVADLSAALDNASLDIHNEIGGYADVSVQAAALADRRRRIQPMLDTATRESAVLQSHLDYLNTQALKGTGFTQQDIENQRTQMENTRKSVNDLLTNFGTNAFEGIDPNMLAQLEKKAGMAPGTLSKGTKTIKEQEALGINRYNPQVVNGRLRNFDKLTGQWLDTDIQVPVGEEQRLQAAVDISKYLTNQQDQLGFIRQMVGGSLAGGAAGGMTGGAGNAPSIPGTKTISQLSEQERGALLVAMYKKEGFGADPNNIPTRLNNPGDITQGALTQHWIDEGKATVETTADGRKFLKFNNPQTGLQAADELLTSSKYSNMTLDAAMRQWSGGGYGAEIVGGGGTPSGGQGGQQFTFGPVPDQATPPDLAKQMIQVNAAGSQDQQLANIRQFNMLIRSGKFQDAQDYIDNLAKLKLPADAQSDFTNFNSANKQASELLREVNKFQTAHLGPVQDVVQKHVNWAQLQKNQSFVDITSKFAQLEATVTRAFGAMRLSENQKLVIQDFTPQPNEDWRTAVTKLASLASFTRTQKNLLINQAKGNF